MQGKFIVLEGPDGSGTTTHSRLLAEKLRAKGSDIFSTAEPTSSSLGIFIREQLKQKKIPSPAALQLLFTADRALHLETELLPVLEKGTTVICDRYTHSTLVYGEALGLTPAWLKDINAEFLRPTATLFCLPPFSVCMERTQSRNEQDILEEVSLQRKVYDLYSVMAQNDTSIVTIDTSGEREKVSSLIMESLQNILQ